MSNLEDKLDQLVQQWSCRQRSHISYMPAECGHHYIGRRHKLLRWDLDNIIPLTFQEHEKVHRGSVKIILPERRMARLKFYGNKDLKDYLLKQDISYEDLLKQKHNNLLQKISDL